MLSTFTCWSLTPQGVYIWRQDFKGKIKVIWGHKDITDSWYNGTVCVFTEERPGKDTEQEDCSLQARKKGLTKHWGHLDFRLLASGVVRKQVSVVNTTRLWYFVVVEGNGIPVELFQILKDDAVKVLHSICQQIWNTQQWPQDWKRSVFIPIPKKGNAKECSNYRTIALLSHASKVMLKILQARLQQYVNCELTDVQAGFRKGRGTRDQMPTSAGSWKKQESSRKTSISALLTMPKPLTMWITINWKILKEMGIP